MSRSLGCLVVQQLGQTRAWGFAAERFQAAECGSIDSHGIFR
jgi:hypothetical protein